MQNLQVTKWLSPYDEVSVARSCEKLKIENLGYDCNELIKQSAPKAFAVVDVEWIHSNGERDTKSDKSLIHIDKSKYTSIASGENFEDGNYELMWYWLQIDDEGKSTRSIFRYGSSHH